MKQINLYINHVSRRLPVSIAFLLTFVLINSGNIFAQDPDMQAVLQTGSTIPTVELQDQHERTYHLNGSEKLLVFIAEMESGKLLHKVMDSRGDSFLKKHNTILLADVHNMPSLIARFIALPRMRDYNYTLYLIRDDKSGTVYPRKKEQISLLYLKNKKIVKIEYVNTASGLLKVIESI